MTHWFHMVLGRGRRLAAYAADELPAAARGRVEAEMAACPGCRREVQAYRLVSRTLRGWGSASLSREQAAAFWPDVEGRIRRSVPADGAPTRPSLRELFWDYPRLSLASAAVAIVLVLGLTVNQIGVWGPQRPAGPNGVEVVSVEAGEDASVMVFQAPGSTLKVIWVFEKPSS